MSSFGFVYILSNVSMPGIYKIGFTDRSPMNRVNELSSSTSIPTSFEIVAYGEVENAQSIENELHKQFNEFRISSNREFFKFDIETLLTSVLISLQESTDLYTEGYALPSLEHEFYLSNKDRSPIKEENLTKFRNFSEESF